MKQIYLMAMLLISTLVAHAQCNYQLILQDNFGDGFTAPDGVTVSVNGTSTFYTVVGTGVAPNVETYNITVNTGDALVFDYSAPAFTGDLQWSLLDSEGILLFDSGFNPSSMADFMATGSCPTCPAITNPIASNVTANTAQLDWTVVGTETSWEIEYGPAPYTQGTGGVIINTTTNPTSISGLASNTAYDFCIRSICGANDLGRSVCGTFTTTPSCPTPGAFSPVTQTASEVQFTWDANGNSSSNYEVEYSVSPYTQGSGGTVVTGVTAPFAQITGLTANTSYDFYVRIDCGGGDFSAWTSMPYTTSTLQSCPDISGIIFSNIDQTQATIAWTNGGAETAWNIEYGTPGFAPGTGTTVAVTTNPYTLTGLSSGTQYDICVTAVCGAMDLSTPVCANLLTPADYCNGDLLVDTGGVAGNYSPDELITYTVCPDNAGDVVYVDFTQFDVEDSTNCVFDSLTIYAGPDTNSPTIDPPVGTGGWCWDPSSNTGSGNLVGFDLIGTLPSGCITFVFESDGSVQEAGFSATVTCAAPPTCPVPTAFSAQSSTDTSITLGWTAGGTETAWEVEYGAPGFVPATGVGTVQPASTNPFTISSLPSNTPYDFYLTAICGAGDVSTQIGPIRGRTTCTPFSVPFTEGFNSTSPTEACWSVVDANADLTTWDLNYTVNPFEGDQSANINTDFNNGNDDDYLISPAIILTGNQRLLYNYRVQSANEPNNMEVLLSTTDNAPASFTNTLLPVTQFANTTYAQQQIDLSTYTGTVYIAWRIPPSTLDGWRMFIDNVIIEDRPGCPDPLMITSTGLSTTSANIGWGAEPLATAVSIEYGPCGFVPGTGAAGAITVVATANPFTLSGLTPNTCYDAYVSFDCSGTSSVLSAVNTFRTLCDPFTVPFTEGFNATSSTESCWTVLDVNADGDRWDLSSTLNPSEGNQSAVINTDFNNGADDDYLISPGIILTGNDRLRYSYRVQSANEPNNMEVLLSTTGIAPADFTTTLLPAAQYANTTYMDQIIDLSAYTGTVYVAWRIPPSAIDGWRMYIDNVRFEAIPGCDEPISLVTSNIMVSSADLGFTDRATATMWEIEYGISGFVLGNGTVVTSSTNPFTLTGLLSNTCYDYFVRAVCPNGGTSPWSVRATFCTNCDVLTAPYTTDFENFTATTNGFPPATEGFVREQCWSSTRATYNWVVAPSTLTASGGTGPAPSINTGNYLYTEASNGVVGDITNLNAPLVNLTGLANPIVEFDYHMYGISIGSLEVLVNVGGVETSLQTLTGQQQPTETTPYNKFTASLSAFNGQTVQIILRATRGSSFEGDIAIDNFAIVEAPSCIAPSLLAINTVTSNSANFNWTENGSATMWEVEVQPAGVAQGTPGAVYTNVTAANPEPISGLTPVTAYSAYVRSVCSSNDVSTWVGPINFTTACAVFATPYGSSTGTPGNDFTTFPGTCWEEGNDTTIAAGPNGVNGAWQSSNFGGAAGSNGLAARINLYDSTTVTRDWLVTPTFDLGAAGHNLSVNYQVALTDFAATTATTLGSDDEIQLLITDDNGATWNNLKTYNATTPILNTGQSESVSLAAYSGNVRLAFWSNNGTVADAADVDFYVDNFSIVATAGIDSIKDVNFIVYPNPTSGEVVVKGNFVIEKITVRNLLGQIIHSNAVNAITDTIDLSSYISGIYLLEITSNGTSETIKILKE